MLILKGLVLVFCWSWAWQCNIEYCCLLLRNASSLTEFSAVKELDQCTELTLCQISEMNLSPGHPYPQVFLVDRDRPRPPLMDPSLVPCWSFPPAVAKRKKRGCEEACAVTVLVLILLLVLGALGLGAFRIQRLQTELEQLRQDMTAQPDIPVVQRQIGHQETDMEKKETRLAAHLTVQIEKDKINRPLRWEPRHGRAFTNGLAYRDGGIQINKTGLYFVYSRVEFQGKDCSPKDSLSHVVFKRAEGTRPLVLLEGHREGFCNPIPKEGMWSSSSYLGAVFHLTRLDWVFVNVSNPTLLSHSFNGNYFGLSIL
ncbi:tumor necrosis factor ligand superfamily member 6 [Conger conger]|uniref:tumor necrosis factor ligand superfamily member 6 n=1 Tax=Conger conger TaxID=82655 RepID=UPI002A5A0CFE|nr:tumor necrosis factor ligand superfamily member 6 [Conger conger]